MLYKFQIRFYILFIHDVRGKQFPLSRYMAYLSWNLMAGFTRNGVISGVAWCLTEIAAWINLKPIASNWFHSQIKFSGNDTFLKSQSSKAFTSPLLFLFIYVCGGHDFYCHIMWWRHQMETFSALLAFVRRIDRSPVNSPHKGQWRGKCFRLMTSSWHMHKTICARINAWVNNRKAGDFTRHRAHYYVIFICNLTAVVNCNVVVFSGTVWCDLADITVKTNPNLICSKCYSALFKLSDKVIIHDIIDYTSW